MARRKHVLSTPEFVNFLRQHRAAILEQCALAIAEDLQVRTSFHAESLDPTNGLGVVLDCIVSSLDQSHATQNKDCQVGANATIHAEIRFREGRTLFSLMQELHHLRRTIIFFLQRRRFRLHDRSLHSFHDALDRCVSTEAEAMRQQEMVRYERFVAALGHDLRTPLSAIMGSGSNLLRHASLAPGHVRTVQRLLRSATMMRRMVEDLLIWSQIREGISLPLNRSDVDLAEVCASVLEEIEVAYPRAAFALMRGSEEARGTWDRDALFRIIMNLMTNAIQYGDASVPIIISIEVDHEMVILRVTNQGPCIPSEIIDKIFGAFQRGSTEQRFFEGHRGLGLGLWIVRGFVQAHQGTIEVQSTAEQGTVFTIRLPRQPL